MEQLYVKAKNILPSNDMILMKMFKSNVYYLPECPKINHRKYCKLDDLAVCHSNQIVFK